MAKTFTFTSLIIEVSSSFYLRRGKRIFDLVFGVILLVALAPGLLLVAILVRTRLGRPVLFTQERPGWKGRPFRIFKFRSMTDGSDERGRPLPDVERLTRFGRFLRASSLDELPELINVIRGEMSFVGPRPLLASYVDRYSPWQARRHEAKPGITGWAQVNGRNALSWEEKFRFDVFYVDHASLWLDLKILWLTFWKTIKRDGISAQGEATMAEFQGNGKD